MSIRVAINGFGRIGRLALRAVIEEGRDDIDIVGYNSLSGAEHDAHLLKYDSVHGRFNGTVDVDGKDMIVNGKRIKGIQLRDPAQHGWGSLDVDVVLECTGKFKERGQASLHLDAGAKKVLISAPGKNEDIMVVYGVNHKELKASHVIVSNASCTTNCLAPVACVLDREIGIERGFMTTIHAYTGDQRLVDNNHKDLHRARAAAMSMVPTSTGAARALGQILPNLKGRLDGTAVRVPSPNVSAIDLTFVAKRATSIEEIQNAMRNAAATDMKGVLDVYDAPLVSIDFNHTSVSSVFALNETKVINGTFVRVFAWYDNEYGFACRMLDTAAAMMSAT